MKPQLDFSRLTHVLTQLPASPEVLAHGAESDLWWMKFRLDIDDPTAWTIVQCLAHVLNYSSAEGRLPLQFMPVSPRIDGEVGPQDHLCWIIEGFDLKDFGPDAVADLIEQGLLDPAAQYEEEEAFN